MWRWVWKLATESLYGHSNQRWHLVLNHLSSPSWRAWSGSGEPNFAPSIHSLHSQGCDRTMQSWRSSYTYRPWRRWFMYFRALCKGVCVCPTVRQLLQCVLQNWYQPMLPSCRRRGYRPRTHPGALQTFPRVTANLFPHASEQKTSVLLWLFRITGKVHRRPPTRRIIPGLFVGDRVAHEEL